jgi:hypothetical protein
MVFFLKSDSQLVGAGFFVGSHVDHLLVQFSCAEFTESKLELVEWISGKRMSE